MTTTRPDLAAAMLASTGEKDVCLLQGHGITAVGDTVEQATIRALNFNMLVAQQLAGAEQ
ncbi:MAG: class II aldolase/adducin family protein [Lysobacterales bacterium]